MVRPKWVSDGADFTVILRGDIAAIFDRVITLTAPGAYGPVRAESIEERVNLVQLGLLTREPSAQKQWEASC
jgi:hypothetical protein